MKYSRTIILRISGEQMKYLILIFALLTPIQVFSEDEVINHIWYQTANSDLIVTGELLSYNITEQRKSGTLKLKIINVLKGATDDSLVEFSYLLDPDYANNFADLVKSLLQKKIIVFASQVIIDKKNSKFYLTDTFEGTPAIIGFDYYSSNYVLSEIRNQSSGISSAVAKLSNFKEENEATIAAIDKLASRFASKRQEGLDEILHMGCSAVPYIILNMNDERKYYGNTLALKNNFKNAFEKYRTYKPQIMIDVLAAILNEITGLSFYQTYSGGSDSNRKKEYEGWLVYLSNTLYTPLPNSCPNTVP